MTDSVCVLVSRMGAEEGDSSIGTSSQGQHTSNTRRATYPNQAGSAEKSGHTCFETVPSHNPLIRHICRRITVDMFCFAKSSWYGKERRVQRTFDKLCHRHPIDESPLAFFAV